MQSFDDNGRVVEDDHIINILSKGAVGPIGLPGQALVVNAAGDALTWVTAITGSVTGSGATNEVAFWTSTTALSGDANLNWFVDPSPPNWGRLLVGDTATPAASSASVIAIQEDDRNAGFAAYTFRAGATNSSFFTGGKANGSIASPDAVDLGDRLWNFAAVGRHDSGWPTSSNASISFYAAEDFVSTATGTYITFNVTQPTTTTAAEVIRVEYNQTTITNGVAGAGTRLWVKSTDNTSGTADAKLIVSAGGSSGGDALITFNIASDGDMSLGVDNSDSNKFKLTDTTTVSASNVLWTTTRTGGVTWTPVAVAAGEVALTLTAVAHTAVVAELADAKYNLGRTVTFTHASVPATQRAFQILKPTYASSSASDTITTAATFYIDAAPAAGANITITNGYALWVDAGLSQFDGGIQDATLTTGRMVYTSTNGRLVDSSNATFNGTDLDIAGTIDWGTPGHRLGNTGVLFGDNISSVWSAGGSKLTFTAAAINFVSANIGIETTQWLGLGGSAGRIVFTDAATDTIAVTSANFLVGSLTSGRVVYVGTSGLLQDDADMTFNGTQLALATQGITGGLLIGGDTLLYRAGADGLRTPDSLFIDDRLSVGTTSIPGAGGILAQGDISSATYIVSAVDGSGGGYFAGASADVQLYRSSATLWRTPDGMTIDLGLNVGSASAAATGEIRASGDVRAQAGLYVGSNTDPSDNDITYDGVLKSAKNSTTYTGYIFVPLTSALTSTSYDGNDTINVGSVTIDTSSVFSAPVGIFAALVQVSAVWAAANAASTLALRPGGGSVNESKLTAHNTSAQDMTVIVPCDSNGDFTVVVANANATNVVIRIWGYFI